MTARTVRVRSAVVTIEDTDDGPRLFPVVDAPDGLTTGEAVSLAAALVGALAQLEDDET